MINFPSIFIYLALLGFGLNSRSLAVEVFPQEKFLTLNKAIAPNSDNPLALEPENSPQLVEDNSYSVAEKPDKWLSLLGIVGSSILYFLILFLLFKPERKAEAETPEESTALTLPTTEDSSNNVELAKEEDNLVEVEVQPTIEESSFPMIGMSSDDEFPYEPISNLDSSEALTLEAINSEMTISEVSQELASRRDSDIQGKLTILTSNNTEIDVVSELIQDLQPSYSQETSAEKKDLRRKAIWQLGQTNDFRAVEPLVQIMPQVDSLEKNLILDAITQITNRNLETINQVLLASLEDDNRDVRKNAIQDLTFLYQSASDISTRLLAMTSDQDPEVQETARWALGQFERLSFPVISVESTDSGGENLASSKSEFN